MKCFQKTTDCLVKISEKPKSSGAKSIYLITFLLLTHFGYKCGHTCSAYIIKLIYNDLGLYLKAQMMYDLFIKRALLRKALIQNKK